MPESEGLTAGRLIEIIMLRLPECSPVREVRTMRLTIGTKIGGGFSLAIAILVVLGVVSYFTATNLIRVG